MSSPGEDMGKVWLLSDGDAESEKHIKEDHDTYATRVACCEVSVPTQWDD